MSNSEKPRRYIGVRISKESNSTTSVQAQEKALREAAGDMTLSIGDFIRAHLDADERDARNATDGPWRVDDPDLAESVIAEDGTSVVAGGRWGSEAPVFETTEDAVHIARHHPKRVLADVTARRALLEDHQEWTGWADDPNALPTCTRCFDDAEDAAPYPCLPVKALAAPYSDDPAFDPDWSIT